MATGRTLTVSLVANTNSFRRGMLSAVRDAQGFQGKMTAIGANLRGVVGPALGAAAVAAGAFAVKLGVDGVKAAIAEEKQLASLNKALDNIGQGFQSTAVASFIDDLQRASGVADDELRPAFQRLVTATRDAAQAQDLLSLALDVSAGTGRDLQSVTLALSKAATGQFTALRRLGVPLTDAAVKSKDLTAVTGELRQAFGGQAAAAAKTFEGQLKRLGIAFSEVQESFGKGFLDALEDTNGSTDSLMDSFKRLEPIAYSLGDSIGTLAKFLGDLEKNTGLVVPVVKFLTDVLGPTTDGILTLYRVFGQGEDPSSAFKAQMLGITEETKNADAATGDYWQTVLKATGVKTDALSPTEEFITLLDEEAAAAERAAEEFNVFADALTRVNAVMAYQDALDELKNSFKENGKVVSLFTQKGRENADALLAVAEAAVKSMEATDSQAQKALIASSALDTLKTTLNTTKMDDATRAALIAPFQALLDDLKENGINVDSLQRKLDALQSKNITVTTTYVTVGNGSYYGSGDAYGGGTEDGGAGGTGKKNRSAVNRSSGISIGSITVQSAPGERAEDSVPRALRRFAFVAGLNG